jgi:murein DD-endopeptidase MepM/ murein hydrolase activator NlpD
MSKFELFYPVSPVHINQGFGMNPDYYAKFHDAFGNPMKGHNGVDLMAVHGQPVYAPMDGKAMYTIDVHGGQSVLIRTNDAMDYAGGTCWFNVVLGHVIGDTDPLFLPPIPMNMAQTQVKTGDLVGYADNTGAPYESSGDHLHFGLAPVDTNGKALFPANGYASYIDPTPYFNGFLAKDAVTVFATLNKLLSTLKALFAKLKGV